MIIIIYIKYVTNRKHGIISFKVITFRSEQFYLLAK